MLQHPYFLTLLHIEVVVAGLLFELGELLLHKNHVILVGHHKVRLVLLYDGRMQCVHLGDDGLDLFVRLLDFLATVRVRDCSEGFLHGPDGLLGQISFILLRLSG